MAKSVGIVAEYNPFHTGHKFQIDFLKQQGFDQIVVAQSGSCVQRGEIAMLSKFARSRCAITSGADLVLEIPFPYSCLSAEGFAIAGIQVLKNAGVDAICFGSESADLALLTAIAQHLLSEEYKMCLKHYLAQKLPFAQAREKALLNKFTLNNGFLAASNDILAIEYIKACLLVEWSPQMISLKRQGASYHEKAPRQGFASASYLRTCVENFQFEQAISFIPQENRHILQKCFDRGEYFTQDLAFEKAVLFALCQKPAEYFMGLPDCNQELAYCFEKAFVGVDSFAQLFENLPTKQYTTARLKRILLYGFFQLQSYPRQVPYLRVLAMGQQGSEALKKAAKASEIPISHSIKILSNQSDACKQVASLENKATDAFSLFCKISQPTRSDFLTPVIKL